MDCRYTECGGKAESLSSVLLYKYRSVDRGVLLVYRPVRPVGVPGSRYRTGLTLASRLRVRRMVAGVQWLGFVMSWICVAAR